jgi:hypothetical protein
MAAEFSPEFSLADGTIFSWTAYDKFQQREEWKRWYYYQTMEISRLYENWQWQQCNARPEPPLPAGFLPSGLSAVSVVTVDSETFWRWYISKERSVDLYRKNEILKR